MAAHAHTTSFDTVEESLVNALWFIRNGRPFAALYALENAFAVCFDSRRERIAAAMHRLGNTPIATLTV